MSTKVVQEKNAESVSFGQKISDFLSKNRIVLISAISVLAAVFIGLVAVTVITENRNKKAFETIESFVTDWETARAASDKSGLSAKEDELLASLAKVAAANKHSFAGARASMTIAEIYFSRKDWNNARTSYLAAAKAAPKAYTAGLNYFNSGVCADELGKQDEAIADFNTAVSLENFTLKPRALFNIGRIEEQRSQTKAAIDAYSKVTAQFPDDEWAKLAESRIIALQLK
jgi:hypothetical protein